jgi:hypothetical protein
MFTNRVIGLHLGLSGLLLVLLSWAAWLMSLRYLRLSKVQPLVLWFILIIFWNGQHLETGNAFKPAVCVVTEEVVAAVCMVALQVQVAVWAIEEVLKVVLVELAVAAVVA